jgi:hypothetical protein
MNNRNKLASNLMLIYFLFSRKVGKLYQKMSTVELPQQSLELTALLLDDMGREKPRISVLEIMIKPFRNVFTDTPYKVEAEEISNLFWLYIKMQTNRS